MKELFPFNSVQKEQCLTILRTRFEQNTHRHQGLEWSSVQTKLLENEEKIMSLWQMEESGGEPDIIDFDIQTNEYIFCDCVTESPKGRRSLCYDQAALDTRKEHKPKSSALAMAEAMKVELLDEVQYRKLQELGEFDLKTSSWLKTPDEIRNLGGAIFGDSRYKQVFIYHNGAESYYATRGFRSLLRI